MTDAATEPLPTFVLADLAGRRRKLQLRLGEVSMLETLCKAGIGAIAMRLASHTFGVSDVRETVRLGLEGGGMSEPEATAIVLNYVDRHPLDAHVALAADVVGAFLSGAPVEDKKKEEPAIASDPPQGPATSATSTAPAE